MKVVYKPIRFAVTVNGVLSGLFIRGDDAKFFAQGLAEIFDMFPISVHRIHPDNVFTPPMAPKKLLDKIRFAGKPLAEYHTEKEN
jgi:hypothetical protein